MKRWSGWEIMLFGAFLFWSAAGLTFTLEHISAADVASWPLAPWLAAFVAGCLRTGDPILILLAFANTHAQAARQWTPALARRWALIILVCSFAIETAGVSTGLLFGDYRYTDRFGPMIGAVPMTIPLAWYIVVTNALFAVRLVTAQRSPSLEAALAGLVCTLYDFILEPFATGPKQYWIWEGGVVPLQNYVAWFILSGLLVRLFAPTLSTRYRRDIRPVAILVLTLLIFVAGR